MAIKRTIRRVRRLSAELGYAQRRLFEIRTGIPATGRHERPRRAITVEELDALYERDQPPVAA